MQRVPAQQYDDFFYIPANIRAPLATFDTIDLGDEDALSLKSLSQQSLCNKTEYEDQASFTGGTTLSAKIGGAQSKGKDPAGKTGSGPDSHQPDAGQGSQVKGEASQGKEGKERDDSDGDDDAPTPTNQSPCHSPELGGDVPDAVRSEEATASSSSSSSTKQDRARGASEPGVHRIGKVAATWLPHQDSDSSTSSGSSGDVVTFRPIHGSSFTAAVHDEGDDDDEDDDEVDHTPHTRRRLVKQKSKDYYLNLYPQDLDPSQISSPSKRKAFEKRLQRLQVKTSPIIRPRSTTPISVHTLDEYAASSPDRSPASPFQDKLKITLPEEFASKPKSPRHQRSKSDVQVDSHFVFSEELLFSHTRSAVVVDKASQQIPVSPHSRRVLIPPTLSPALSPKVSRAAGQITGENAPQLVYFENEKEENVFGEPAKEESNEDWATFTESTEPVDDTEPVAGSEEVKGAAGGSESGLISDASAGQETGSVPRSDQLIDLPSSTDQAAGSTAGSEQLVDLLSDWAGQCTDSAPASEPFIDFSTIDDQGTQSAPRPEPVIDFYNRPDQTPLNIFDEAEDEILTVNIQSGGTCKPANIQLVLSAASSSTPSPSSPESSDEVCKTSTQKSVAQDGIQRERKQEPEVTANQETTSVQDTVSSRDIVAVTSHDITDRSAESFDTSQNSSAYGASETETEGPILKFVGAVECDGRGDEGLYVTDGALAQSQNDSLLEDPSSLDTTVTPAYQQ